MTTRDKLAYLGGFIDGEGTIWITKSNWRNLYFEKTGSKSGNYSAKVAAKQVKPEPLQLAQSVFGGSLWQEKKNYGHFTKKRLWVWSIQNRVAVKALNFLLPFLIIKKEQAKLCILLDKNIQKSRKVQRRAELFKPIMEYRQTLYAECKALNGRPLKE